MALEWVNQQHVQAHANAVPAAFTHTVTPEIYAKSTAYTLAKSRFEMILSVKEHEMHHRGQLMLIERILGIVPHMTRAAQARRAALAGKACRLTAPSLRSAAGS